MKERNSLNRILEIFWLIMTFLTLFMGVLATFRNGLRSSYMFFVMTILVFLLYLARRHLRIKNKTEN